MPSVICHTEEAIFLRFLNGGHTYFLWFFLMSLILVQQDVPAPQEDNMLFFFFFCSLGALRMENSATSCPDVNYWCRVRLANPAKLTQRRRNHAAADGCVYKQALRSVRRPPSVFLSTHWSSIKLLFLPTTLKSAVKFFRVFSQPRGSHLRCHVDQFIHFQFLSLISFQKVQETAWR